MQKTKEFDSPRCLVSFSKFDKGIATTQFKKKVVEVYALSFPECND
jgi:hypothetical protein